MFSSNSKKGIPENTKVFFNLLEKQQKMGKSVVILYGATKVSGLLGHLISLEILQKSTFKPSAIYGSQFGSLFAYMYNYRIPYRLLRSYLHFLNWEEAFDFNFQKLLLTFLSKGKVTENGLIYGEYFSRLLESLTNVARESMTNNLYVFAERLVENRLDFFKFRENFTDIALLKASLAFSGVLPPIELNKCYYTDCGISGSLPLKEIIENEKKKNVNLLSKNLIIVAFHEGFLQNYPELTLSERLLYSFHEKVRYTISKNSINIINDEGIQLYLFSYFPFSIQENNIFKMGLEEREVYTTNLIHELNLQFTHYVKKFRKGNSLCPIYPFVS